MTNRELIQQLQQYPDDSEVLVPNIKFYDERDGAFSSEDPFLPLLIVISQGSGKILLDHNDTIYIRWKRH